MSFVKGGNDSRCSVTNTLHLYSDQRVPGALPVGKSKEREIFNAFTLCAEFRNVWKPLYTAPLSPHEVCWTLPYFVVPASHSENTGFKKYRPRRHVTPVFFVVYFC